MLNEYQDISNCRILFGASLPGVGLSRWGNVCSEAAADVRDSILSTWVLSDAQLLLLFLQDALVVGRASRHRVVQRVQNTAEVW